MNSFFLYDTSYCKKDEDDPKDAIVYFFPVQTPESQRYFLCCQLAGVAKFLKSSFSVPSVIGLDQGKFAFVWLGAYLLVVGGHSNVNTNLLKDQLEFLCGIFCFYHGSINNVLKGCDTREEFLSKMELSWSRYITLSQCFSNSVLQLSLSALPLRVFKKNSHIMATANRLLHVCQLSSSVIAGAVFYNSRVLSTQFMPQLTNYLSLLSNANASAPVSNAVHILRNLPPDVELKYAYLNPKLISNILKYNHTCVGSRIRVKTSAKSQESKDHHHQSSGSEGDVDSGNCSESIPRNEGSSFNRKTKRSSSLRTSRQKRLCTVPCCVGHSKLYERNLYVSRNRNLVTTLQARKGQETEDSGIQANDFKRIPGVNTSVVNVLCRSHAQFWATSFVTHSKMGHTNFTSTTDMEFRCSLCTNHAILSPLNDSSLKQWNSDVNLLSEYSHHQCSCKLLTIRPCEGHSHYSEKTTIQEPKLQILKCQTGRRSYGAKRHSLAMRKSVDGSVVQKPKRTQSEDFSSSSREFANIEDNELQRRVLYVQRYGGSTLVLLLNKVYDEKVINYLWNCGFTILRELEYLTEKQAMERPSFDIDPPFYILLYNYVQKVLKEYPHFPSLLLSEKHSRRTIQQIQEDFQNDPYFQMMCLLSSNQSVFAYRGDQNFAFYLQPESDSRKPDPLYNLAGKAARRLGKYFKVEL